MFRIRLAQVAARQTPRVNLRWTLVEQTLLAGPYRAPSATSTQSPRLPPQERRKLRSSKRRA